MNRRFFYVCLLFFAYAAMDGHAQSSSGEVQKRVDALLKQMTMEEKVGQLVQSDWALATGPASPMTSQAPAMAAAGRLSSILNAGDLDQANYLQRVAVEKSRLHIPLIIGRDVIHGYRTVFPVPLALAASFDTELVSETARIAAEEAYVEGVRWTFSPMADLARDPRWGRVVESAGEDPYLGARMAEAYVRGYQGDDLRKPGAIAATVKHFAAYGAAEAGRDYNSVDMSETRLRSEYLPAYKAAIDAGAATVMSSFNTVNGVPATANSFLLTKVLRGEWKFRGFVVSDWSSVMELTKHGVANDASAAARKALVAGTDMDMASGFYSQNIARLVTEGKIPATVVDEAVRRVLRIKMELGLFENPYPDPNYKARPIAERRAVARLAAEESFVLLKNSGVLPLNAQTKTIALIGPLADAKHEMLGPWSLDGKDEDVVTLHDAMQARAKAGGWNLLYEPTASAAKANELAAQADVIILALGETAAESGEAASKTSLDLAADQAEILNSAAKAGKPVVLVLFSGRPLVLTPIEAKTAAILEVWLPGVEAGEAIARTLFGDASPSGKLPMTFPRALGQVPIYYSALRTGRPAGETDLSHPPADHSEKYVSRYIDEVNKPLYPFGFGLSYSTFAYSDLNLSTKTGGGGAVAKVVLKNTGTRTATEVVQLYVGITGTETAQPMKRLVSFKRVTLAPGEERTVEFVVGAQELLPLGESALEEASYTFWAGGSSDAQLYAAGAVESK